MNNKLKEVVENNILLEQKNQLLSNQNVDLRKKLDRLKYELEIYINCHNKTLELFKGLQSMYVQNQTISLMEELSKFFGINPNANHTIADLEIINIDIDSAVNKYIEDNRELYDYCKKHEKIYIYGAGIKAKRLAGVMDRCGLTYKAFVVSDGKTKQSVYIGHDVKYISEIKEEKNFGIVIGLNQNNAESVYELLKKNNIDDYFYFR